MYNMIIIFSIITLVVFFGCITTYRYKKYVLVEGVGTRGIEFYWWLILLVFFISLILFKDVGKWLLLGFYALWLIMLFLNHWRYFLFGAPYRKIKAYNNCFRNTIKIFKESEIRIRPDLYHVLLSVIVAIDLIFVVIYAFGG